MTTYADVSCGNCKRCQANIKLEGDKRIDGLNGHMNKLIETGVSSEVMKEFIEHFISCVMFLNYIHTEYNYEWDYDMYEFISTKILEFLFDKDAFGVGCFECQNLNDFYQIFSLIEFDDIIPVGNFEKYVVESRSEFKKSEDYKKMMEMTDVFTVLYDTFHS